MKKLCGCLLGLCIVSGFSSIAPAQEKADGMMSVPKVLTVTREFVKPGKTGAAHDKSERDSRRL